jgi:hypothetical protein
VWIIDAKASKHDRTLTLPAKIPSRPPRTCGSGDQWAPAAVRFLSLTTAAISSDGSIGLARCIWKPRRSARLRSSDRASQPAVVIATPAHRAAIEKLLSERSLDVDKLKNSGMLHVLDADEMLAGFTVDGMPAAGRVRRTIVPVIETASAGRKERVVRA